MDAHETPSDDQLVTCAIDWFGSKDARKHSIALEVLCEIGPSVVPLLIAEADKSTTPIEGQYYLLELARTIGGQRGPDEYRHIRSLRRHWHPAIREKVEEVFKTLRPQRRTRKAGAESHVQDAGATAGKLAAAQESAVS